MVESNKTYKIVNAMTGTVLDLSVSDNKSLVGDDWQGTEKQKVRGPLPFSSLNPTGTAEH